MTEHKGSKTKEFNIKLEKSRIVYMYSKISAQPHNTLCIQFLDRENNDINNTLPLGKQICLTTVWGCVGILSIWRSQENILIFSWKSRTFFLVVHMTFKCNVSPSKFFLWSSAVKYYSRTGVKWSSANWISQRTIILEEHEKCGTVEPRLSGHLDYPDFFSGPLFFMNINDLRC